MISPKKKGFFAQKRPNLAQNWHFWSIWARLIQCPVDGSVGGCGARAVSRKTPIYFMNINCRSLIKEIFFFWSSPTCSKDRAFFFGFLFPCLKRLYHCSISDFSNMTPKYFLITSYLDHLWPSSHRPNIHQLSYALSPI